MTKRKALPVSVVLVFALFSAVVYFPALRGRVPIPADLFYYFAAFQDGPPKDGPLQSYADIGDLITSFYMFRSLEGQAIPSRELPLWNPYILSGAPFVGHSQSELFYPPNWVYLFLPTPNAWSVALMVRMFLAGVFMALLLRSIGASLNGAILAGLVFSACGVITAWQGFSRGDTSIWLPFVCWAVIRLRRHPCAKNVVLTALAFAIPVMAGHPETALFITMVGSSLALTVWIWPGAEEPAPTSTARWTWILLFAAAGVLAMGIAAIQLLPTAEFLKEIPSRTQMVWGPLPMSQILGLVSRDALRSPNSGGVMIPEAAAYVGMITLLLVAIAPFYQTKRYVAFFVVLCAIAIMAVYGFPPMPWLISHTPLKTLRIPRAILIASFGLATLAGIGLSALETESFANRRRRRFALVSLAVVFIAIFPLVYILKSHTPMRIEFLRRPSTSRALLLIAVVPLVVRLFGWVRGRTVGVAICALGALDLATFSYGFAGFSPSKEIFPQRAVFDFLKSRGPADSFRIAQLDGPYPVNAPMLYGLSSADGYDILTQRIQNFAADLGANPTSFDTSTDRIFAGLDRRMDLLNVKYFVVRKNGTEFPRMLENPKGYVNVFETDHVAVFENPHALPRAFSVPASGVEVIKTFPENLDRVRNTTFDPTKSVVLSTEPVFRQSANLSASATSPQVAIEASDFNGYQLRVNVPEPSIVIVSQTFYPGWKARVDRSATPVYDADYALVGIPVPAGEHEVELRMEPDSLKVGERITMLSGLVAIVLALPVRWWRAGRRNPRRMPA